MPQFIWASSSLLEQLFSLEPVAEAKTDCSAPITFPSSSGGGLDCLPVPSEPTRCCHVGCKTKKKNQKTKHQGAGLLTSMLHSLSDLTCICSQPQKALLGVDSVVCCHSQKTMRLSDSFVLSVFLFKSDLLHFLYRFLKQGLYDVAMKWFRQRNFNLILINSICVSHSNEPQTWLHSKADLMASQQSPMTG